MVKYSASCDDMTKIELASARSHIGPLSFASKQIGHGLILSSSTRAAAAESAFRAISVVSPAKSGDRGSVVRRKSSASHNSSQSSQDEGRFASKKIVSCNGEKLEDDGDDDDDEVGEEDPQVRRYSSSDSGEDEWDMQTFPWKLFALVSADEGKYRRVFVWNCTGSMWKIVDMNYFMEHICFQYFNCMDFDSFLHEMNNWGFLRICNANNNHGPFYDPQGLFVRDVPERVLDMMRPVDDQENRVAFMESVLPNNPEFEGPSVLDVLMLYRMVSAVEENDRKRESSSDDGTIGRPKKSQRTSSVGETEPHDEDDASYGNLFDDDVSDDDASDDNASDDNASDDDASDDDASDDGASDDDASDDSYHLPGGIPTQIELEVGNVSDDDDNNLSEIPWPYHHEVATSTLFHENPRLVQLAIRTLNEYNENNNYEEWGLNYLS